MAYLCHTVISYSIREICVISTLFIRNLVGLNLVKWCHYIDKIVLHHKGQLFFDAAASLGRAYTSDFGDDIIC